MTVCTRASLQTALNAILQPGGNQPPSTTKSLLLYPENSASVAIKPIDQMTVCTKASLQTALNAILQPGGNQPPLTTKSLLLYPENSASVATRLISPLTICIANRRQVAEPAMARPAGNQQHLTITSISDLTVITGRVAKRAIPILVTTKNTPVITAMNTRSPILPRSIVKRDSRCRRPLRPRSGRGGCCPDAKCRAACG